MEELIIHTRLYSEETMSETIMRVTGFTEKELEGFVFVVRFDRNKIKLPRVKRPGGLTGTDQQDIHMLIESNWSGSARTADGLDLLIAPLELYDRIPLIIEMYPKEKVDEAVKGGRVDPPKFTDYVLDDEDEEAAVRKAKQEDADRIMAELDDIHHAFISSWGTAQKRKASGKFDSKVLEEAEVRKDKTYSIGGKRIAITPSGQVRMRDGSIGPAPVDKAGKRLTSEGSIKDLPVRIRKDGSMWMRVRNPGGKRKTKWRKISS